jgi:hypothetical protein
LASALGYFGFPHSDGRVSTEVADSSVWVTFPALTTTCAAADEGDSHAAAPTARGPRKRTVVRILICDLAVLRAVMA